ncbi:MAG: LysR family transcriptional regulator [Proteobacteria bacterium]|nr:LysR family transcriptional regulator [Pseudomonadota bacterium]
MQPLEGFYYFARVAEHQGFAPAARALGIPKSRLSRHVAALEEHLGSRLIQRSTRRFVLTELGSEVLQHARAMLAEADAAVDVAEAARAEPRGTIRFSCPVSIAQSSMSRILPAFLARFPAVRLQADITNRRVDVLGEGFDAALRVRRVPSGEDGLVMRTFRQLDEFLVATPGYLAAAPPLAEPADLARHTTLEHSGELERRAWDLTGPTGEQVRIEFTPQLACLDFVMLRDAVLAGRGISLLPESVVRDDLASGALVRVLPQWNVPQGILHVVFPSRRGMRPSVRAFIDFLATQLPATL